jgi:small subunit ribosomal protein S1
MASNQEIESTASPSEEQSEKVHPMDLLLAEEAYDLETPRRGEIRTGVIARVSENDILVDIGAKSEGVISSQEMSQLPDEKLESLAEGQEVTVYVVKAGDRDGMILLSFLRAEEENDWQRAEDLLEAEENYEGEIAGFNKGGLIVKLGRLRGFVPASQVSLSRRRRAQGETPDQRWGEMIGEPIVVKVIEVDRRRNRLILSEREAAREARDLLKERLIEELKPGEVRTGHVISLADFGAFVDIGGADGLVHTSELSWKRVSHPREVLEVGQEIEVKVLDLDLERKRISLSIRELEDDPWGEISAKFQEGQLVEGTVTKLTKFGAFARLAETDDYEVEGLIHISELSERRVEHPREVVNEGDVLTLRIINVDPERRRIGLSLRKVDSADFADQDWKTAMEEIDGDEEAEEVVDEVDEVDEVEDFDAALDAEDRSPENMEVADGEEPEPEDPGGGLEN